MDGMKRSSSKFLLVILTGFITGNISGVSAASAFISYRIDRYHQEIQYLHNIINERDLKLERLEESINKSKFVLKGIEIYIESEVDELDKIELEKAIRKKYTNLIGREVRNIDIEMAAEVTDNRLMKVNNKEYKISVNKLMMADILKLWIDTELME